MAKLVRRATGALAAVLALGVAPVVTAPPAQAACSISNVFVVVSWQTVASNVRLAHGSAYLNGAGCASVPGVVNGDFVPLIGGTPFPCVPVPSLNGNDARCITALPLAGVEVGALGVLAVVEGVAGTATHLGNCAMVITNAPSGSTYCYA